MRNKAAVARSVSKNIAKKKDRTTRDEKGGKNANTDAKHPEIYAPKENLQTSFGVLAFIP